MREAAAYIHRVEFQRLQAGEVDPVTGAVEREWCTVPGLDRVPAQVLTGAGSEPLVDGAKRSEIEARINVRWFAVDHDELLKWRIVWGGRVFSIVSAILDATGRQEWRIECGSGVGDGS